MIALLVIGTAVVQLYTSNKAHLYDVALEKHYKKIHHDIENIFTDRTASSITLALALAKNAKVTALLCEDCDLNHGNIANDVEDLTDQLSLHTEAGKLWIQIIDNKGVSRFRSWTDKAGDSLRYVRFDVRQMLSSPSILSGMSVGRFSLTLKAMVPVKNEANNLRGMLEVITHPDSFSGQLKRTHGNDSVILIDKRFQHQLTHTKSARFVEDYHISNSDFKVQNLATLEKMGANEFTKIVPIREFEDEVITQYVIQDSLGRLMGYWFIFENKDSIDTTEIRLFEKQFMFSAFMVLLLLLFLIGMVYLQRKTSEKRKYYRDILNATSEILMICNREKIIETNKRFFEFFSEYKSLKEFHEEHNCISERFVDEDNFLTPMFQAQSWLDYVINNPNKEHIAKIDKQNEAFYFQVKVSVFEEKPEMLYSVSMHDITRQIRYQRHLEQSSDIELKTGVLNKTAFTRTIHQEVARSLRYKNLLCLALIEIDELVNIQKIHGFDKGDKTLSRISRMIKSLLRESDFLSRTGSDQFAIIMPDTHVDDAYKAVQRIVEKFNCFEDELTQSLSINAGIADLKGWENQEILFKKADNALQKSKRSEQDQVMIAGETPIVETEL